MRVKCVNNTDNPRITLNKEYEIINLMIRVKGDGLNTLLLDSSRFEVVLDENARRINVDPKSIINNLFSNFI